MSDTITNQFLEDSFRFDFERIGGVIEDLASYNPGHTDLTDLSAEEKVDRLIASNIKSQTFVDACTEALKEEREIRSLINTLIFKSKQASKEIINSWNTAARATANIDANVRTILEKQREHINKMADRTVAINKTKRALRAQEPEQQFLAPIAAATLVAPRYKLQDVPIPNFEGDLLEFYYFWKLFSKRVDDEPIDDAEKFSLLFTHLRRKPHELVRNLPLNTIGYNQAKDRLKCKYGNKEEIADIITKRIFAFRQCNSHAEVREMFNNADALISQLDDITGEQCKSKEIHRHIEQQLTKQYAGRLFDCKQTTGAWDLTNFREAMRKLVAKDDDVDRMTGSSVKPRSYGLAAVPPKQRNCMFCESSNHSPSKCPLPPQVKNGKILKAKRCTRCLRSGHFNKQCTSDALSQMQWSTPHFPL